MGVVAPLSAVGAALLPVAVGVALGERPALLTWVGIAAAVPAIWLVSTAADPVDVGGGTHRFGEGVVDGLLAGVGFGLMFAALGQVEDTAGLWPLAAAEVTSVVTVVGLATLMGHSWWPRERSAWWGIVVGTLAAGATVLFLLASQSGLLAVAAVLSSLYPVFTVLLAATVLRERIHGPQAVGLVLAGTAVALVALG
jgi:drug/metabolite transporter (DMT)-like permease